MKLELLDRSSHDPAKGSTYVITFKMLEVDKGCVRITSILEHSIMF